MNKSTQTPSGNNTARVASTAITPPQAEKFFTAGLAQDRDTITTNLCTFSKNRERCRFSPKNNRLLSFALFRILAVQSEKEIAEPGNSNKLQMANKSTPSNRAIFVCSTRTPKENNETKIGFVAFLQNELGMPKTGHTQFLSMVACNGKGSPFAVFHLSQFSSPLHAIAQTLESLAVALQKSQMELLAMLFKFLTGSRLKITIRANSEQEARQRLQLSDSAICIARYSNAFLAQKQAKLTACKGVSYV